MHAEYLAEAWYLHTDPIKLVFYKCPRHLFLRQASCLDAFSTYPLGRSCPACLVRQQVHQRRRTFVPLVLEDPSSQIPDISSRYQTNCLAAF